MFNIFCCILYFIICLNIVRSQGRSHLSLFAIFESKDWCVKWMERRRQQRLKRAAIINENRRNLGGKRTRTQYERKDPKDSPFWKYMTKETYRDPTHRDGKLFRRRFRMPFDMFLKIVNLVREKQWFPEKQSLRMQLERQEAIPLEIKLLGVFRVLGRGVCFDDIEELTHVSAETHRKFFRDFVTIFSLELYDIWIHGPRSDDEVFSFMAENIAAGYPGLLGSTDCVHIAWDKAPAFLRNIHKGKEGYPTRSFEVTVNHRRWIMAATKGFYGSYNDKTIVRYDSFVCDIHEKKIYADNEFVLHDQFGVPATYRGLYLICDGGYHKWRTLICPFKHCAGNKPKEIWSKMLESLRKDVECTFGILKGRFNLFLF